MEVVDRDDRQVRTDAEEGAVPDADLAAQAGEQVDAEHHDGQGNEAGERGELVRRQQERRDHGEPQRQPYPAALRPPVCAAHTRVTSVRPKIPRGRTRSVTTMTTRTASRLMSLPIKEM